MIYTYTTCYIHILPPSKHHHPVISIFLSLFCYHHLVLVPISHKFPILCFPSKPQSQTNEEKRDGMRQIIMLNHWLMMFLSPQSVRMDSKHFLAAEGMIMTYLSFSYQAKINSLSMK